MSIMENCTLITKVAAIPQSLDVFLNKHLCCDYYNIIIDQQSELSNGKSTLVG